MWRSICFRHCYKGVLCFAGDVQAELVCTVIGVRMNMIASQLCFALFLNPFASLLESFV